MQFHFLSMFREKVRLPPGTLFVTKNFALILKKLWGKMRP